MSDKDKRFVEVFKQGDGMSQSLRIIQDVETGVCYLQTKSGGYGSCLTPLLDRDGRPVVRAVDPGTLR